MAASIENFGRSFKVTTFTGSPLGYSIEVKDDVIFKSTSETEGYLYRLGNLDDSIGATEDITCDGVTISTSAEFATWFTDNK